ncbi:MAG: hypothetical protein ACR2RB_03850, partial [Gammaproteobacteria bacterium]
IAYTVNGEQAELLFILNVPVVPTALDATDTAAQACRKYMDIVLVPALLLKCGEIQQQLRAMDDGTHATYATVVGPLLRSCAELHAAAKQYSLAHCLATAEEAVAFEIRIPQGGIFTLDLKTLVGSPNLLRAAESCIPVFSTSTPAAVSAAVLASLVAGIDETVAGIRDIARVQTQYFNDAASSLRLLSDGLRSKVETLARTSS